MIGNDNKNKKNLLLACQHTLPIIGNFGHMRRTLNAL